MMDLLKRLQESQARGRASSADMDWWPVVGDASSVRAINHLRLRTTNFTYSRYYSGPSKINPVIKSAIAADASMPVERGKTLKRYTSKPMSSRTGNLSILRSGAVRQTFPSRVNVGSGNLGDWWPEVNDASFAYKKNGGYSLKIQERNSGIVNGIDSVRLRDPNSFVSPRLGAPKAVSPRKLGAPYTVNSRVASNGPVASTANVPNISMPKPSLAQRNPSAPRPTPRPSVVRGVDDIRADGDWWKEASFYKPGTDNFGPNVKTPTPTPILRSLNNPHVDKTMGFTRPITSAKDAMDEIGAMFGTYVRRGSLVTAGYEPVDLRNSTMMGNQFLDDFTEHWQFITPEVGGIKVDPRRGSIPKTWIGKEGMAREGIRYHGGTMGYVTGGAAAAFNIAGLSYDVVAGFNEGGIWGVKDAMVLNTAANMGVASKAYQWTKGTAGTMKVAQSGLVMSVLRNMGAYQGAAIGQAVLGTPGALIGGYVGAAPIQALGIPGRVLQYGSEIAARSGNAAWAGRLGAAAMGVNAGMVGTGLVVGAAAAQIAMTAGPIYAAYKMTEFGAQYTQQKRQINTAGSMATFMTQNANTMRSRAIQAIGRSHMNARSALGQEATYMNRNTNYFSPYRAV